MKEEARRKWKLADAGTLIKNSLSAILKGEFLMRLGADRYFLHIAYTFLLLGLVIFFSLQIEATLGKMEQNNARLHEMELLYQEKTFEVATLSRRSTVEKTLESLGSSVREAEKPATTLGR
ncbi:MAG: hypothetical protein IJV01_06990 [Bacteroidales bacterium]|nr:hypothetical protein [Bacteroidales bacterium]